MSEGEAILAGGELVRPEELAAINNAGDAIFFESEDAGDTQQIFVTRKIGNFWQTPELVSASLGYTWNYGIQLSHDESAIRWTCSNEPYYGNPSSLCQANADNTGAQVLLDPATNPVGLPVNGALAHPDFALDGGVVFMSDWIDEWRVWRVDPSDVLNSLEQVAPQYDDDNTPCVLPDGRIATAWYDHVEPTSANAVIKVMDADGSNAIIAWAGPDDIYSGFLGCSL